MQYIGRGSAHVQTIPRVPPIVNTGYFVFERATFLLWPVRVILFRFATMPPDHGGIQAGTVPLPVLRRGRSKAE